MNLWIASALGLSLGLIPCGYLVFFRDDKVERLVGFEFAGVLETLILMLLAQGFNRTSFYDLALALALLSFGGGLVFARFLERWD